MRFPIDRVTSVWLSILLLLAAMNFRAGVLCVEPDGSVAYEVTDAHGRCAPCPGSPNQGQPATADNCVDLPLLSSSDFKMSDTSTALVKNTSSPEERNVFVVLSWLSLSFRGNLDNNEATSYADFQVLYSDPFLARSVILLI